MDEIENPLRFYEGPPKPMSDRWAWIVSTYTNEARELSRLGMAQRHRANEVYLTAEGDRGNGRMDQADFKALAGALRPYLALGQSETPYREVLVTGEELEAQRAFLAGVVPSHL